MMRTSRLCDDDEDTYKRKGKQTSSKKSENVGEQSRRGSDWVCVYMCIYVHMLKPPENDTGTTRKKQNDTSNTSSSFASLFEFSSLC
jgi:hypothetical protein